MRKIVGFSVALILLGLSFACLARPEIKIFSPASYSEILHQNEDKEFTLVFWSLICSPCLKELQTISNKKLYTGSKFIFVSIDGDDLRADVTKMIRRLKLESAEHWIFDSRKIDEIITSVDESWYGEVPRNYYFDYEHNRIRLGKIE